MAKAERLSRQQDKLEHEYRALLRKALAECEGGRWGLFGHNEHLGASTPAEVDELRNLAGIIDRLRERIGEGPFSLHQEFEAARGRVGPNDFGEPKKARDWLQRLSGA